MQSINGISDFLERKGALQIFVAIEMWESTRHVDFREEIDISPNTLTDILDGGVERGLWRTPDKHYELTELGKEIFEDIPGSELFYYHEKLRQTQQRTDIKTDEALLDIEEADYSDRLI